MISVIHPAARPERLHRVVYSWFARKTQGVDMEYRACFHDQQRDDFETGIATVRRMLVHETAFHAHVNTGPNHPTLNSRSSYVDNVNLAASKATGDILVLATDDLEPPEGWDRLIREALADAYSRPMGLPYQVTPKDYRDYEAVLRCSNGNAQSDARRLILHPIMTRARYERQGWFVCPRYTGVFSDNDLTERAYMDGVVVEAPHIVFRHHHPIFDPSVPVDDIYRAGNSPEEYKKGKEIFLRRGAQGFPLGAAVDGVA